MCPLGWFGPRELGNGLAVQMAGDYVSWHLGYMQVSSFGEAALGEGYTGVEPVYIPSLTPNSKARANSSIIGPAWRA